MAQTVSVIVGEEDRKRLAAIISDHTRPLKRTAAQPAYLTHRRPTILSASLQARSAVGSARAVTLVTQTLYIRRWTIFLFQITAGICRRSLSTIFNFS